MPHPLLQILPGRGDVYPDDSFVLNTLRDAHLFSVSRFPEAEHTVNPYREGVPHGVVEVRRRVGGRYLTGGGGETRGSNNTATIAIRWVFERLEMSCLDN